MVMVVTTVVPTCLSCADPVLIYDKVEAGDEGFQGAAHLFPDHFRAKEIQPEFSGELGLAPLTCRLAEFPENRFH